MSTKKYAIPAFVVVGFLAAGVWWLRRSDKDPDRILRLARAEYEQGTVVTHFEVDMESLKRAAAREIHDQQWHTNRFDGGECRQTIDGYMISAYLENAAHQASGEGMPFVNLPLDVRGTNVYTVPLLFPMWLEHAWDGSYRGLSYRVKVEASSCGWDEFRTNNGALRARGYVTRPLGSRELRVTRPALIPPNDVTTTDWHMPLRHGESGTLSLETYGTVKVPAEAARTNEELNVRVKAARHVVYYEFERGTSGDRVPANVELTIPCQRLDDWKNLHLLFDLPLGMTKVKPEWVDEAGKTLRVPVHGRCCVVAGARSQPL